MHGQKPLSLRSGFEPAHLPLPLPGRLMRDFISVVRVARGDVLHRCHHIPVRGPVASEFVSDQPSGFAPLPFQQLAQESPCGCGVSAALDQDLEHITILVNGTPQVVFLASDLDEDLVKVPSVTQTTSPLT